MTYEKCESKVNNLLASMEQMTSTTEKLRVLTKIVEEQGREIAVLLKAANPELNKETPEPTQTANWLPKQGGKGPFEVLNDVNTQEYRELRAELDRMDHPIQKQLGGIAYTVWLMRDGQAVGRRKIA